MLFTILIAIMTTIVVAFLALWLARPELREWMERPKFRMLDQLNRFDDRRKL